MQATKTRRAPEPVAEAAAVASDVADLVRAFAVDDDTPVEPQVAATPEPEIETKSDVPTPTPEAAVVAEWVGGTEAEPGVVQEVEKAVAEWTLRESAFEMTEDEPSTDVPVAEQPAAEEPQTEEPKTEEPQTAQPAAEEPQTEEPKTEQPTAAQPAPEQPKTEQPLAEVRDPGSVIRDPIVEEPITAENVALDPAPPAQEPLAAEPSPESAPADDLPPPFTEPAAPAMAAAISDFDFPPAFPEAPPIFNAEAALRMLDIPEEPPAPSDRARPASRRSASRARSARRLARQTAPDRHRQRWLRRHRLRPRSRLRPRCCARRYPNCARRSRARDGGHADRRERKARGPAPVRAGSRCHLYRAPASASARNQRADTRRFVR